MIKTKQKDGRSLPDNGLTFELIAPTEEEMIAFRD